LAEGLGYAEDLDWSPDGETIAVSAGFGIHTLTLEEPNPRLFARDAHTPSWSPDGEFLAYYQEEDGSFGGKIATQAADGGDAKLLEVSRKDIYSFESDLDWLDCPER
jgi:hypothetical protein